MGAIAALAAVVALAAGGVAAVGVHALDDTSKTVTTTVEAASTGSGNAGASSSADANAAFARSGGKSAAEVDFSDFARARAWFEGQPREVCIALAMRSALR